MLNVKIDNIHSGNQVSPGKCAGRIGNHFKIDLVAVFGLNTPDVLVTLLVVRVEYLYRSKLKKEGFIFALNHSPS